MRYFIPVFALFALSLSACDGCQGGYLLQVQDGGSDSGFGYTYDAAIPDTVQPDTNLPIPVDAAVFLDSGNASDAQSAQDVLDSHDAAADDQGFPDTWVKDQSVEDAKIEDANVEDSSIEDSSRPDTALPDTTPPDTFVPECVADTIVCQGDHLITCDNIGLIASDVLCAPFGCNAALIPNACRACDPSTTLQCLNDEAVTCSPQGAIVTHVNCDFACNDTRGICNECAANSDSCSADQIIHCGQDGLIADNPQDCNYGCGLHVLSEDGGFIEDSGSEDASSAAVISCNACRPSTARCEGEQSLICDDSGEVSELRDCTFGCNPDSGECRACDPSQSHQCLNGQAVTCSAAGVIAVAEDCAYGCDESDGLCDACNPNLPQQCLDDDAVSCSATGDVTSRVNCGAGKCNPLAGQCNQCEPEIDFCANSGDIMSCELDGTIGSMVSACSYGCDEPTANSPICLACEPSSIACHDDDLVTCDTAGNIDSSQSCTYGCAEAVGDDRCMACTPSTTECHGDDSVLCSPEGRITTTTNCAYGCRASDGQCNDCTPNSSACQANDWVVCDASGHASSTDNCADHGDQCNAGICSATGCELDPTPLENANCVDGKFCTAAATCQTGVCTRTAEHVCDDSNPCTQDSCDDAQETNGACVYDPQARDGANCEDGLICTVNTTCNNGNCEGGQPLNCSDDNPCTEEHCDENVVGGCTEPDSSGLENSRCGDESAGEEKLCCSGTCIDSDVSNCGSCGDTCGPACGASPTCMHFSCIDEGIIVINEMMINPNSLSDANGEWLELYNPGTKDINIKGWHLLDDGSDSQIISQDVIVPAGGYTVLVSNNVPTENCGISDAYAWGNYHLSNTADEVILKATDCEVDRVEYGSSFVSNGSSAELSQSHQNSTENDDTSSNDNGIWCSSVEVMTCGDTGTPGAQNSCP